MLPRGPGLLLALLAVACGNDPPKVVLAVANGTGAVPFESLARLRLIVRECGKTELGLVQNLPTTGGPGTTSSFDAAVVPGATFYVWLQGWAACAACQPPAVAMDGECTCFDDESPRAQQLVSQACTRWLQVREGRTEIPLMLLPWERDVCPPPKLDDCSMP